MVYTFYFNSVSTITHVGICSRDAYHCQCHRHVQEGSISQHHSNFSGIQYFQDIDTILMIADHPAFTKNAGPIGNLTRILISVSVMIHLSQFCF